MGVKAFYCFYPNSLFYLEDVIRNKVVINIVAEPNKDRSLNIVTPTEELLVPPENRLEIQSSLGQTISTSDHAEAAPLDPRGEI